MYGGLLLLVGYRMLHIAAMHLVHINMEVAHWQLIAMEAACTRTRARTDSHLALCSVVPSAAAALHSQHVARPPGAGRAAVVWDQYGGQREGSDSRNKKTPAIVWREAHTDRVLSNTDRIRRWGWNGDYNNTGRWEANQAVGLAVGHIYALALPHRED